MQHDNYARRSKCKDNPPCGTGMEAPSVVKWEFTLVESCEALLCLYWQQLAKFVDPEHSFLPLAVLCHNTHGMKI